MLKKTFHNECDILQFLNYPNKINDLLAANWNRFRIEAQKITTLASTVHIQLYIKSKSLIRVHSQPIFLQCNNFLSLIEPFLTNDSDMIGITEKVGSD